MLDWTGGERRIDAGLTTPSSGDRFRRFPAEIRIEAENESEAGGGRPETAFDVSSLQTISDGGDDDQQVLALVLLWLYLCSSGHQQLLPLLQQTASSEASTVEDQERSTSSASCVQGYSGIVETTGRK